jgi:hypothetical protein
MSRMEKKDFFEGVPHNRDAPSGRSFRLAEGVPPLDEDMVPFYASFIPVKLKGEEGKIAAAFEALRVRDQLLLESILNPSPCDVDLSKIARVRPR